ncbi:unnamed protein product [Leptosia nina]|uniref:Uncharacterized protein n=1 Tax=Leptosia nina TaxID=320188 RepID=A0AAV1K3E1_9NEOP
MRPQPYRFTWLRISICNVRSQLMSRGFASHYPLSTLAPGGMKTSPPPKAFNLLRLKVRSILYHRQWILATSHCGSYICKEN